MKRFAQLFAGRTDHYGIYTVQETQANGKQKGQGRTLHEPLTDAVWEAHLSGKKMLGVVPIREDGTVSWFAGDIDVYKELDHYKFEKKCRELDIPVVCCLSKSKGIHMYAFADPPIQASAARKLMAGWLKKLSFPKAEVFPKQDAITEGATGNWINLPYFGGDKTERYAIHNGAKQTLAGFEQAADAVTIRPGNLAELDKQEAKAEADRGKNPYRDAPPCIEKMAADGIQEGGRNRAALHIGVYFQKAYPDEWEDRWNTFINKFMDPPLGLAEINDIARKINKGKYQYMCKEEPMCSLCDKNECLSRKWGVGPQQGVDYAEIAIDRIIKLTSDPPVYYLVCNGTQVKMVTDQLLSPERARRRIYEVTGLLMPKLKPAKWEDFILKLPVETQEAPDEVDIDGQVEETFREWVFNMAPRAHEVDSISRGNPFYNPVERKVVFRGVEFISVFKRQRRKEVADRDIWAALSAMGCRRDNVRIKGKQTKCWCFPCEEPWFPIPGEEKF